MKKQSTRLVSTVVLAMVFTCGGCALFHNPPAYAPIHQYAIAGDADAVAADLSQHPNDLNLPDDGGLTPLHLAASHCRTNVIAVLLDKGAKINEKAKDGATPLHLAAQEGCASGVSMLLNHGAKVNPRDSQGRTPLKRAEVWRQHATAEILRHNGGLD